MAPPAGFPGRVYTDAVNYPPPATFPTDPNLWLWLIGSLGISTTGTGPLFGVTKWADQSGNTFNGGGALTAHDLVANAPAQSSFFPEYEPSAFFINGLPAVAFGSRDSFGTGMYTALTASGYPNANTFAAYTSFYALEVFVPSNPNLNDFARLLNTSYQTGFWNGLSATGANFKNIVNGHTTGSPFGTCETAGVFSAPLVLTMMYDPTTPGSGTGTGYIWVNGGGPAAGTFTNASGTGQLTLALGWDAIGGSGEQITANIAELLLRTATTSTAQRQATERYLGHKYGIAVL